MNNYSEHIADMVYRGSPRQFIQWYEEHDCLPEYLNRCDDNE